MTVCGFFADATITICETVSFQRRVSPAASAFNTPRDVARYSRIPLAQTPGMMNVNELLALFVTGDRIKNRSFGLRAKAFDVAHLAGFARGAQLFNTGNPQLFLKSLRPSARSNRECATAR